MSGAHHNGSNRELRAVKMRSTVKEEVRYNYGQELRHIREMRKRLVDRLPQVFATATTTTTTTATTNPHIPGEQNIAVRVEPTDMAKMRPDSTAAPEESVLAYATPSDLKKETLRFFRAFTARLIGLCTLSLGILSLREPIVSERSTIYFEFGRLYTGTGLFILILAYQNHLRALGTLLLCEAVAETIKLVLASNSGVDVDFLIEIPMTGIKGALGWLMVSSRE